MPDSANNGNGAKINEITFYTTVKTKIGFTVLPRTI